MWKADCRLMASWLHWLGAAKIIWVQDGCDKKSCGCRHEIVWEPVGVVFK